MKTILIVEDNVETAKNISLFLRHHGYSCQLASTGSEGVSLFFKHTFDLVLLDVMLPDGDGFEVCTKIRQHCDTPIIMLTARVLEEDLVRGLNCGANDYVKKPYSNKELVARIQAHLRTRNNDAPLSNLGPYSINLSERTIAVNNRSLELTRTEFELMNILLQSPGRVYSREQLFIAVSQETSDSFDRTVDVHLHNLRKKITLQGVKEHYIKSVYGIGYKLDL